MAADGPAAVINFFAAKMFPVWHHTNMTLISTSGTQNEFFLSNIEPRVVLQVMSSAWWKATGEYKSLSEQQILDCSWDYGWNHACDGGDPDLGIKVGARGFSFLFGLPMFVLFDLLLLHVCLACLACCLGLLRIDCVMNLSGWRFMACAVRATGRS